MKKRMHLAECRAGDVLAEEIKNHYGVFLLARGTIINQYILQRLAELGIEYLTVSRRKKTDESLASEEALFDVKYEHIIKDMKHLVHQLSKGNKIDYAVLSKITDTMLAAEDEPDHVIKCLIKIREADDYTYYHCVNAAFYAMQLACWINLPREDIKIVIQAALLHDLGKAHIPNEILNKKGLLNEQEFKEVKRHVFYGYQLLKDDRRIADEVKDAILMHHEREDRSGYPLRAGGDDLSIYTKIVSVADVYDAMTSNRPYKQALTPFEAFEEILTVSGLDIRLVKGLVANLSRYYTGSRVLLNNGETGIIAYIPPHCSWRPIIDTGAAFLDLSREQDISIIGII